jgi:hypothetical protein
VFVGSVELIFFDTVCLSVSALKLTYCAPAFDSIRQGGPTRTSADVSVPRFAGFSLIT